ncbi:hypothetical protein BTIS_1293 [Bifidobacterium tissieri]|uniref:Uncharacterized protein n=1 Tax=Bifidobacterium tissieri TaxID=1630162 RepID=A0A261FEN6_9BIFI|nr:hypothetical protein BTIS_1293 [Bifidobacterium tissieri]
MERLLRCGELDVLLYAFVLCALKSHASFASGGGCDRGLLRCGGLDVPLYAFVLRVLKSHASFASGQRWGNE